MASVGNEAATISEQQGPKLPQKKFFRQRAHVNIFNDVPLDYPINPDEEDWSKLFPTYFRPHTEEAQTGGDIKRPLSPSAADGAGSAESLAKRGPAATPAAAMEQVPAQVEFADIGCGYGGLLVALAPLYPNTLMVGMEIRTKLVDYLQQRIEALRRFQQGLLLRKNVEWVDVRSKISQEIAALDQPAVEGEEDLHDNGETNRLVPGHYENIAAMRINCQKYLPNFFKKGQLSKMFILFADPHFKRRKHKARIISTTMLAEYAYVMRTGGIIYMITDVKDLYDWSVKRLDNFPLFERIPDKELKSDPAIPCVINSTEEGKKVARNKGQKYLACYRRIEDTFKD
ncbi:tRNA (guanine-N(7)-)-methyltransferase (tRNA(m7G46)-methyltransferase) [Coemansia sp. 'formosensis']|nr:tRNA (guanine-N(7)-)-methyltransferase (tRNA(m7G46)-methyltransferase) [Coemansia sp. 'formosensis']